MTVGSLVVQDVEDLKRYLDENTVDIAVIAVPVSHAQRMVEALCERGVKGFWNFAPLDLKVPDGTSVVNVHLDEGLEILEFPHAQGTGLSRGGGEVIGWRQGAMMREARGWPVGAEREASAKAGCGRAGRICRPRAVGRRAVSQHAGCRA